MTRCCGDMSRTKGFNGPGRWGVERLGFILIHLYSPGRHLSMPLTDVQVASLCDKEIPQDTFKVHPFRERGA